MSMRVLKVGHVMGSKLPHAVVYINGKLKLACRAPNGQWRVCETAEFCTESKHSLLNQIF